VTQNEFRNLIQDDLLIDGLANYLRNHDFGDNIIAYMHFIKHIISWKSSKVDLSLNEMSVVSSQTTMIGGFIDQNSSCMTTTIKFDEFDSTYNFIFSPSNADVCNNKVKPLVSNDPLDLQDDIITVDVGTNFLTVVAA
jgi:hypothetical protein